MAITKTLLKISLKNIFRNKRRSILTLLILVLGSTGLILVGGFFDYLLEELREYYIHSQTGHIQVNVSGYYEKGASAPFKFLMKDVKRIQELIENHPNVLYTVPRLNFGGMANSEDTSMAVLTLGVDPIHEHDMGTYQRPDAKHPNFPSAPIIEGEDLDPKDSYGTILGKGLLKALDLKVGDSVTLLTTQEAGAIDGAEFHVRGAFQTVFEEFDQRVMKINLETAQQLLGIENQLHSLLVILDKTKNTAKVKKELETILRANDLDLELISWEEQGNFYRRTRDFLKKIYATVQFIISVVFFFSIANTINMNLFERMREFGTMMAIGNTRSTVFLTIFFDAAILGLFGAIFGLVIGSITANIVSTIGIQMPPPPIGDYTYYAMILLEPLLLLEVFLIGLISTLLAALIPGYRASHFKIIHALGYI